MTLAQDPEQTSAVEMNRERIQDLRFKALKGEATDEELKAAIEFMRKNRTAETLQRKTKSKKAATPKLSLADLM